MRAVGFCNLLGISAVASLVMLPACSPGGADSAAATRAAGERKATSQPAIRVEVETVAAARLTHRIPVVGTIFAGEEVVIATKASGVLQRTFVDVASIVNPGDPLAQVNTLDYEVAVREAEASLGELLARLGVSSVPDESFNVNTVSAVQRARAQLENARFSYDRLAELSPDAVAQQEMNDASARLRVAEAEMKLAIDDAASLVASARVRSAQLSMAEQKLRETITQTPPVPSTLGREGATRWVVSERLVTEGQFLNAAAPVYKLIICDPVKLRSKIPERYAADVRLGQTISLFETGAEAAEGRVTRISPAVDPASRTFEVEALIENDSNGLKPGAFARGVLIAESLESVLAVPIEAVASTGGETHVFVFDDGVARRRNVQVGKRAGGRFEIERGLTAGERIIARIPPSLADGAAVQVRAAATSRPAQGNK